MPSMTRNAIVVDLNRCIGCYSCETACKQENGVALGEHWNRLITVGPYGEFPHIQQYWLPTMCQQCENAQCVEVCPVGASYRDPETNIVLINEEACIGCQACLSACPYGVRQLHEETGTVQKCTLCNHLTAKGELPACVKACCGEARFYGDLDDPESDASKVLASYDEADIHRLADSGNHPATAYILSPRFGEWRSEDWTGKA